METKENDILDKLINKTTLAAEQLLGSEDLEVKLAKNMTEEDEKNPKVIALEKLISITEKLNNMHTKRINAKLKQEKMQKLANETKSKAQCNFQDLPYEEKFKILHNDEDFYKVMHDFPRHAIGKKYIQEALNCFNDPQAYKVTIHKMIEAEKATLHYFSEVGIIEKLSNKEIEEKLSPRYNEIDQVVRNFRKEEIAKNKEISKASS